MSYPPTASHHEEDGANSPLMNGNGNPNGDAEHGKPAEEEEEIDLIRRYEDFSTVDWIQDSLHERNLRAKGAPHANALTQRLDKLDGVAGYLWRLLRQALEEGQNWVIITIAGVGIGISAALISVITVWLSDMKMGYCTTGWWLSQKFCCLEVADEGEGCAEWRNWGGVEPFRWIFYILFAAMFSFSAAHLVRSFAPYAAGSGISEIKCILGGFVIKGFLGFETFLIKGLTLTVKMREIVTASSAAGVAVAFGSPIGGVLFSMEEMNQTFSNRTMWQSFVCALVATFTLASMDPFRTGKLVLFQVSYDRDWHYFEIPAYIIIGIFGGLYGAFVIRFNLQVAAFRRKHLAQHGVAEAVTLATISAFVGYLNRFLRIDMTESLDILFRECEGGGDHQGLCQTASQWRMVNSLLLATIVRVALIVVSYGCKVPCGIFVPSMAAGATFGRMIGILVKAMHSAYPTAPWFAACQPDAPCITPGTYAFLGAAAAMGGVTRLTVTVVVIMFELTGALTYILPTMIVMLVTKAVSDQFGGGGISDRMIRFNGYPFLEKEDKEDGDHAFIEPIANVMKKDIIVMNASGMPLQEIGEIVQSTSYQGFPVLRSEEDRTVTGFVRKTELRYALDKARRTRSLAEQATCTFECTTDDTDDIDGLPAQPDIVLPGRQHSFHRSLVIAPRDAQSRGSGVEAEHVDFGQYVDETPLTVSPKMPLEIVMQLFRRMGPRVILVSHEGQLVGLVTVKDVLRYEAAIAHREAKPTVSEPRDRNHSMASSHGWHDARASVGVGEESTNGLELTLEEAFAWARIRRSRVYDVFEGLVRRARGRPRETGHEAAYELGMTEERRDNG